VTKLLPIDQKVDRVSVSNGLGILVENMRTGMAILEIKLFQF
jgi:hypothetical protein